MKTKQTKTKNLFAMMNVLILVGALVLVWDFYNATCGYSQRVERNAPGEGDYEEELHIQSEYFSGDYKLLVEERELTEKQVEELFGEAKKEIDHTFLGDNKDMDHVLDHINLQRTYQDGMVRARWSFDNEDMVGTYGEIYQEKIEKPTIVEATVELKYKDYIHIYQFPFRLIPYNKNSAKGVIKEISRELQKENAQSKEINLPQSIYGQKIKWTKKMTYRGLFVMGLGIFGYWLIPYGQGWERNRQGNMRKKRMLQDYPSILNQLSILLGVGISLPEAVDKITRRYEEKRKGLKENLPGYELLAVMNREMKDGMGTIQAIDHFGKKSECKEYRKLSMLMKQNLRKGNAHMVELLERENMEAFEMRKTMARKAGEEAAVKLLFPMIGMLGIIIVILLVPAFLTLGSQ